MSNFLKQEYGVAMSGVKWEIGNFKLWQSTNPDVILFTVNQPVLAKDHKGRYQFGISQFRQESEGTYKITGGSALFTLTSAIQFTPEQFERVRQQWIAEMRGSKYARFLPANPRFIPLNVRNAEAQVLINPASGAPDPAHLERNIGTPGGYNSFLVNLTELGAQEWVQGIKSKTVIPAGVKMMYEYLRMMPTIGAEVKVHGSRVFTHLSTDLNVSVKGFWYGGSAQISAAWEKMVRDGDVEITFIGSGLSPELEEIRTELVSTFAEQAREQLFKTIFEPAPEIEDAKAGKTGGFFGGANFALKWKKVEDAVDLKLTLKFEGWTWLKASMDANLISLVSELDNSYISEVNTQMTAPAVVSVDSDPLLENVAISWSATEGKGPEAPIFGPTGGSERFLVTSQKIDDVTISYKAKVNFTPSSWPIITTEGKEKIGRGGNQVFVKPTSWIGRHYIYLFFRDGNQIVPGGPDDYLVCNVTFTGPHIANPIKASAKITGLEPLEFSYPLPPDGDKSRAKAKFSAFGIINNRLIRSAGEQEISFEEEAVFILASAQGKVDLVSQNTVFTESMPADSLEMRLLKAGAKPIVEMGTNGSTDTEGGLILPPITNTGKTYLKGTVTEVKFTPNGPALVIETKGNGKQTVRLRNSDIAESLLEGSRKEVEIELSADNYADSFAVIL